MSDLLKDKLYLFALTIFRFLEEHMELDAITAQCPAPINDKIELIARRDGKEFVITIGSRDYIEEED